jgi:hypothetical protein
MLIWGNSRGKKIEPGCSTMAWMAKLVANRSEKMLELLLKSG